MERHFSAGGAVYKHENGQILWLVTQSVGSALFPDPVWRLPKGWIDDGPASLDKDMLHQGIPGPLTLGVRRATEQELQDAALREVREEGGVDAEVVKKIGTINYVLTISGKKILKFVTFYLMRWKCDLPEGHDHETQAVEWLEFNDALKRLHHSGEKETLKKARIMLE